MSTKNILLLNHQIQSDDLFNGKKPNWRQSALRSIGDDIENMVILSGFIDVKKCITLIYGRKDRGVYHRKLFL